ncbi:apoptosis inhibitor 5-like protein API5 isoform X2 [Brassica napus]|uniref:apoptosis inhibitor 5-like protein API5 isoform X2 n=1 Tax=Brassica napus TaxID=3708 RepID=UPI0006AAFAA1|nr:apoptosis inhibitor 5-like protein API5 isoform X2 [Brassica napus]
MYVLLFFIAFPPPSSYNIYYRDEISCLSQTKCMYISISFTFLALSSLLNHSQCQSTSPKNSSKSRSSTTSASASMPPRTSLRFPIPQFFPTRVLKSSTLDHNVEDYEGIIKMSKTSMKAKQLASQLIPRYFKFFPTLSTDAFDAHIDCIDDGELGVRVQAIRGLPLFCKDSPDIISKIVDVLVQLLNTEEPVERDAVHKALMSLIRQDPKASLTALFTHAGVTPTTDDQIREKVLNFIRDKVFPIKAELLKPQEEMERHITDLIKQSLEDVTGGEFKMFMDFLTSLSIFGGKAAQERMQELVEIIEGQADLNAQFDVSDTDHIDRFISCLPLALPFYARGAPTSRFLNYLNNHIIPVFDKLPEERKLDLLKALADISPYTTAQEARQMLPSIVQLLKKYMPAKKTAEEMNFTYVECLLYAFHHLAHKVPNATNSLCGYKIVTGQPSDRLGEDFSELNKDFTERLTTVEDLTKTTMKKLTQGMSEHNKAMSAAKTDEEKANVKTKKQNTTTGLRTCNNILAMTKPLHAKVPSFIGDTNMNLSWKEATKPLASAATTTTIGGKRPANSNNGSGNSGAAKKRRGSNGMPNQLVNKAFEGISSYGGGRGGNRSQGRRGGGGRRGRGRGRGHW